MVTASESFSYQREAACGTRKNLHQLLDLDGRLGYHRSPRSEVDIHDSRDSGVEGYDSRDSGVEGHEGLRSAGICMNLSSWNPANTKSLAVDGWIVKRTGTASAPLRRAIAGLGIRRGVVSRVIKDIEGVQV